MNIDQAERLIRLVDVGITVLALMLFANVGIFLFTIAIYHKGGM